MKMDAVWESTWLTIDIGLAVPAVLLSAVLCHMAPSRTSHTYLLIMNELGLLVHVPGVDEELTVS